MIFKNNARFINCTAKSKFLSHSIKHIAAALYGVGARLDENPALFFTLRNVNIDELISKAITQKSETLLNKSGRKSKRVIESDDLSAMFGIEMEDEKQGSEKERTATKKPAGKRGRKPRNP